MQHILSTSRDHIWTHCRISRHSPWEGVENLSQTPSSILAFGYFFKFCFPLSVLTPPNFGADSPKRCMLDQWEEIRCYIYIYSLSTIWWRVSGACNMWLVMDCLLGCFVLRLTDLSLICLWTASQSFPTTFTSNDQWLSAC